MSERLALRALMSPLDTSAYHRPSVSSPAGCADCPFAEPDPDYAHDAYDPNPSDPDEGHYICGLKLLKVWGENPKCSDEDWENRIRGELADMLGPEEGQPVDEQWAEKAAVEALQRLRKVYLLGLGNAVHMMHLAPQAQYTAKLATLDKLLLVITGQLPQ